MRDATRNEGGGATTTRDHLPPLAVLHAELGWQGTGCVREGHHCLSMA